MIILIKLLLAHFVSDFILQPKKWVQDKEKFKLKSSAFYLHLLVHFAVMSLLLWDIRYWKLILSVTLIHGVIDWFKIRFQKTKTKITWFIADQLAHLVSILLLWQFFYYGYLYLFEFLSFTDFWLYLTALVFLTWISGSIIKILLSSWSLKLEKSNDDSLSKAGTYIGILERLFVFTFILTGHWEAIGFLIAAKSVFRFGDLKESKDRKLTEYILIGTLLSFGLAILTGIVVLNLSSYL